VRRAFTKHTANKLIREQQQGLGRPIISTFSDGYRLVAVGNKLYWSKTWKTFHDFLFYYIKKIIGEEWGNNEISKPYEERHPILQWYDQICKYQRIFIKEPGKVASAPMLGYVEAYMHLSYNLYLIAHNTENNDFNDKVQKKLVTDLKRLESFPGAYYESYVYAFLVRSGFEIKFEDQTGKLGKRCECVIYKNENGNKYTVEAKAIRREGALGAKESFTKKSLEGSIRDQIYDALQKTSEYKRVIFIDINLPNENPSETPVWFDVAIDAVKNAENLTINKKPSDPAYIILTNHPHHYHESKSNSGRGVISLGYKINDFGHGKEFTSLRSMYHAKIKHKDVNDIIDSIEEHYNIPVTFDCKTPTESFDTNHQSIYIGQKYFFEDAGEYGLEATVTSVCVNSVGKELIIGTDKGSILKRTMSDNELEDYNKHGNAIFGEPTKKNKKLETAFDLFEWLIKTYSKTKKEKLLEFMSQFHDIDKLKKLSQSELAEIYCERCAISMWEKGQK
jgi:hypothetical protein